MDHRPNGRIKEYMTIAAFLVHEEALILILRGGEFMAVVQAIELQVVARAIEIEKLCNYWLQGNCSYGDKCNFLHSWSIGDCFSSLTVLEGH
ncbi:hypothetical protein VitviT2T_024951 [Vitis vinifera]|uniref:C3H1-type domain-containing protein n=1 Tax=Vitis vinifera TaxID=29760 RepID=A0ABY9DJA2_VITVI|nr:hypothetical protein VitviT2T_024951 [Vitis vinifera]